MAADPSFPWGDRRPDGGYRIGDRVGIIYSDHEHYIFDNPEGVVAAVEPAIVVRVDATIGDPDERLYLIERGAD